MQKRHIRVQRPFRIAGEVQEAGKVLEVDRPFAAEMIATNKATACDAPPAPAPVEVETETPAEPVRSRRARNAG